MIPARMVAMFMFQGGDGPGSDHMQLLVIFVGVIAFVSLVQLLAFVIGGITAMKVWKGVSADVESLKQRAFPLVEGVQSFMADATPKVKVITENASEITTFVKSKLHEYEGTLDEANRTIKDVNAKTRAQVDRVDGMVSSALKATSDVSNTIHRGIRTPVMEVAGVVNGLKAALDVLVGRVTGSSTSSVYSRGASARSYSTPGPTRVPSAPGPISSHPSSNVAPSPAAAAVVDRLRGDKVTTIY